MSKSRILILDDESSLRTSLFRVLDRRGFQVLTANRIEEAQQLIKAAHPIDLALIDISLPDGSGLDFMNQIKNHSPQCAMIILTGNGTIDTAIRATQQGASQFMTKPFNLDDLLKAIDRAFENKNNFQSISFQSTPSKKTFSSGPIIGESESIQEVLNLIERVSNCDSTVLITGESGTGKELIARAIHNNSSRSRNAFIPINCGAIPSELLESELFGHTKGAFTGAIANRVGRFELADGGTIFLDEIGDLEPNLQVKILRALQERSFEPVGSTKTVTVNVRVIAATNINLEEAVENNKFREDLFYRLNVIPIFVPPLRERKFDIPILLNHFIKVFNKLKNSSLTGLANDAQECLVHYRWPGNIRELENLIERLSILKGSGLIELIDLPLKYKSTKSAISAHNMAPLSGHVDELDFNSAVDAYENSLILKALEKTGWNRNQAALLLKLNRTTLVEKIKKKGLKPPEGDLGI